MRISLAVFLPTAKITFAAVLACGLDMFAQAGYIKENGVPEQSFGEYDTPQQTGDRIQRISSTGIDELIIRVEPVQNPPAEFGAVAQLCAQFS